MREFAVTQQRFVINRIRSTVAAVSITPNGEPISMHLRSPK